jgi:hypothetical protein
VIRLRSMCIGSSPPVSWGGGGVPTVRPGGAPLTRPVCVWRGQPPPPPLDLLELYEACVICAEPLTSAALGACGHLDVCAVCSLRSRVLYDDCQCPLCKAELPQVVLAALRPDKSVLGVQQAGEAAAAATTNKALFHLLALLPERSATATASGVAGWGRQVYKSWNASLVVAPLGRGSSGDAVSR